MPGYPCCCSSRPRPPPVPSPWPPGGTPECEDNCGECLDGTVIEVDDCDPEACCFEGCPMCVNLSLVFASTSDPLNCPCDQTVILENLCLFWNYDDRYCAYQSVAFELPLGVDCAAEECYAVVGRTVCCTVLRVTVVVGGVGYYMDIYLPDIGDFDCSSSSYLIEPDDPIAMGDYCEWVSATVAFGTCA